MFFGSSSTHRNQCSLFAHSWFIWMLWLVHMPPPCWECFMLLELILASAVSSKWYKFDGHMKALRIKLVHTINVGLKSIKANFIVGGARKQTTLLSSYIFYPLLPQNKMYLKIFVGLTSSNAMVRTYIFVHAQSNRTESFYRGLFAPSWPRHNFWLVWMWRNCRHKSHI